MRPAAAGPHAFLSYHNRDREEAEALGAALRRAGVPILMVTDPLASDGHALANALRSLVERCDACVMLDRSRGERSYWVNFEASAALASSCHMIVLHRGPGGSLVAAMDSRRREQATKRRRYVAAIHIDASLMDRDAAAAGVAAALGHLRGSRPRLRHILGAPGKSLSARQVDRRVWTALHNPVTGLMRSDEGRIELAMAAHLLARVAVVALLVGPAVLDPFPWPVLFFLFPLLLLGLRRALPNAVEAARMRHVHAAAVATAAALDAAGALSASDRERPPEESYRQRSRRRRKEARRRHRAAHGPAGLPPERSSP